MILSDNFSYFDVNNQTTSVEFMDVGGLKFFHKHLTIYMPYTVLLALGVLIGCLGNILIIGSIIISKDLRTNSTCILCFNLALADFTINFVVNSFTIVGVFVGKSFFDKHIALCKMIASVCLIACGSSLVTMGYLAVNRYVCLFHFSSYNRIFSFKNSIYFSISTWMISLLIDLPNFFGWGAHVYDLKALACLFDRLKVGYTITFFITCIFIPCTMIAYCYARIFWYSITIKRKVNFDSKSTKIKRNIEAIRITKSLFASFFLFSICWIPVGIILLVDLEDYLPITAHTFTNLPAHLNSAINPIFYAVFNPKIREGYMMFLNKVTCKKISIFENKNFTRSKTDIILKNTMETIDNISNKASK